MKHRPFTRLSVRDRVTLASTGVLTVVLILITIAGNLLLQRNLVADAKRTLRDRAAAQLATLEFGGGKLAVSESPQDAALDAGTWVFANGTAVVAAAAAPDVAARARSLASAGRPTFVLVDERVRLYARPAYDPRTRRQAGTIVVGQSTRPYENTERLARNITLLLDALALLAGALLIRWAVGRALRPVEEMTTRAAEWSEHDQHRRFAMGEPYDEITGLAATLDALLARIDAEIQREQRLTAEIAHELRTPLSGIRAEAELAMRPQDGVTAARARDSLRRIVESTDRMNAAIETLLAAHVFELAAEHSCNPDDVAGRLLDSRRTARGDVRLELIAGAAGSRVAVDARVLEQTLAPLLENAIRHARNSVEISVARRDGAVVIAVCDDGEGFADADVERVFEAGVSASGGAGLGLPLARRLAGSFGARIVAVAQPAGGRIELIAPRADA